MKSRSSSTLKTASRKTSTRQKSLPVAKVKTPAIRKKTARQITTLVTSPRRSLAIGLPVMASGIDVTSSLRTAPPVTLKAPAPATLKKTRSSQRVTSLGHASGLNSPVMASGIDVVTGTLRNPFPVTLKTKGSGRDTALVPSVTARRSRKPRLLWIGDALVPTGFATVTHAVLDHLRRDWDVLVSGVNYDGAAHDLPYQVIPACHRGNMWGVNRFAHLCADFEPAAVIINNDWWNVADFARVAPAGVPVIGYMPVDGGNLDPADMAALNSLHSAVWYTRYGHREAAQAGFKGARHIIPHGIDASLFQPLDRAEARRILDLNVPKNAFIVGNLNRNQPRKRLDVTIQIFADWIRQHNVPNAFLLLHCAKKDSGWDLRRVAAFHGVADRLLLTGEDDLRDLKDTRHLQLIYNSLDVQMTTTLGEGWGLTTMEGMACGIPQIVPDSSALAEWATPALKVPCSRLLMHPEINTTGALVDDRPFVAALQSLYQSKALRTRLSSAGIALTRRPEFRWKNVARQFQQVLAPVRRRKASRSLAHA